MQKFLLMIAVVGCGKKEHTKDKASAGGKLWGFGTGSDVLDYR
jgi:hypothetical protein